MSRLSPFIPALVSVAVLIVSGCARPRVDVRGVPPSGHIEARAGRPGVVVAAPHGIADARTGEMAEAIARRTGFGLVVARGDSLEPGGVDEAYVRRVREAAQGPLLFYAEIHGNDRPETAGRIEIATVGVDRELALRLRTLAEMIRDAHVRAHPEAVALEILVEPADRIVHTASGAKRGGIFAPPVRALHIELPRSARLDFAVVYTSVLADFLGQAVTVPAGR